MESSYEYQAKDLHRKNANVQVQLLINSMIDKQYGKARKKEKERVNLKVWRIGLGAAGQGGRHGEAGGADWARAGIGGGKGWVDHQGERMEGRNSRWHSCN